MPRSILADRAVFEENYVPEKIIGRDEQIKQLVRCLKPVRSGDFTVNIYVHGPTGVGKTLVCTSILKKCLPKRFIYVDCFEDNATHDIMEQVMAQAGIFLHGRLSTRDMIKRLKRSDRKFLICLDRCELIKEQEILESFIINGYGLVLISNKPLSYSKFVLNGNSKLYLDEIEFGPYDKESVFEILKSRVSHGISADCISDDLLSMVSGICDGDARRALQIVKLAAREAEIVDQDTITVESIEAAAKKTRSQTLSKVMERLSEKQKIIFDILKDNRRMSSGELFRVYKWLSREEVNDRSYRNQMTALKELGLVKETGETKGKVYEIA
ncbi:MAG: orc1/cdc6 family replication initiation protein [Thaumarchaeota archaeon]|nr:orc1/cdc6 family replication initiation protein [Nitrososphaerota archaeon]